MGIDRRSIVRGAAWSIPVLAAAVAVPVAAASQDLVLAFDSASYPIDHCAPFTPAVTATRNGQVAANEPVTVTLTDGLRFPDGSSSYTGVTDASGKLTLPPVSAPNTTASVVAISASLTATSGTATTTAPAEGTSGTGQVKYEVITDDVANNTATLRVSNTTCTSWTGPLYAYTSVALAPNVSSPVSVDGKLGVKRVRAGVLRNEIALGTRTIPAGEYLDFALAPNGNFSFDGSTGTAYLDRQILVTSTVFTSVASVLPHDNHLIRTYSAHDQTNAPA